MYAVYEEQHRERPKGDVDVMNIKTVYKKVIYCEDCKWWEHYEDKKHNCGYSLCGNPKMMNDIHMLTMYATDYCSKGEHK